LNRFLKLLLAVTCLAVLGYVGLSVYSYYAWKFQVEETARLNAELAPLREKCSTAKSLLTYYATPKSRQRPGMMSWDEARTFAERNCSPEQLRPQRATAVSYPDLFPLFRR
jgi:hypothetical protein